MTNYYNKDLYKILNVNFDATLDEIKQSYRKLVREGKVNLTAAKINEEAYEMLNTIVEKYLRNHKPKNSYSTMEMWKLRQQAQMQAEEVVLASVVYNRY